MELGKLRALPQGEWVRPEELRRGELERAGHGAPVANVGGSTAPAQVREGRSEAPGGTSALPPVATYGQQHHGARHEVGAAGKTVALGGFGLQVAAEFGDLPLEARLQTAVAVSQKRRRKIDADDGARLAGWREDYGRNLVEGHLELGPEGARMFDRDVKPLAGAKGRTTLGIFVLEQPGAPSRIVKLLPQTGFHDALVGNLLAEKAGGPKIHRFGRLEVSGGTERLEGYRAVMFLEMEHLFPGATLGRLKELMKERAEGKPERLELDRLAAGLAGLVVSAMIAGVSPNDPDVMFDRGGASRPIDGDFYTQVFDPEETIGMLRVAFREHGWDSLREPFRDALTRTIREAPVDDRKRRSLLEAAGTF